ncbi:MAG: radical SAM protein, partial [Deltaproteobacteria bacterium]|nr:radical SAM protein [Deltaproteobacteria bacterium]
QVHHPKACQDLITICDQVHQAAPQVPLSALVSASLLDEDKLVSIQATGVDIIGVGLDAANPDVFHNTRGKGTKGPHDWEHHWKVVRQARRMFGPLKVNCHVMVGLGETDRDLMELFANLKSEQIAAYLFSFNPEEGTPMDSTPRAPLHRMRRIQLIKYLMEKKELPLSALSFNQAGDLTGLTASTALVGEAIQMGEGFMTDGCPDRNGEMTCNRPFGSYRPGEPFRDYPFKPDQDDLAVIAREMRLDEIWTP